MAQAYIDEGPAGGNAMMADFDAAAAEMYGQLEVLLTGTEAAVSAATQEQGQLLHDLVSSADTLIMITAVVGAVALAIAAGITWFLIGSVTLPIKRSITHTRKVVARLNPNFQNFKTPVKSLSGGQRQVWPSLARCTSTPGS